MQKTVIFVALAALIAAPAMAQVAAPAPKPVPARAPAKAQPTTKVVMSQSPHPTFDEGTIQRMGAAMLSYTALEVQGGWPTLPASTKYTPGSKGPEVALLRQRLAITEDLPADRAAGDAYDDTLAAAVRHFQGRHGLEETGSVGPKTLAALNVPVGKRLRQLGASLDRLARMDFTFGQRYVVVILPAAFAEAIDGDKVVRRYVVQVGRPERPSPTLTTHITTVNLNPTWTVPLSILKKDIIPKMRKDPSYLSRMHMRLLDASGAEIDPSFVDWSSDQVPSYTVRQDPGPWNSLGFLRVDMPNPHSVYMHDTPHREPFSSDYRFHSSGCARIGDVRAFAAWVLHDTAGWDRSKIEAGIASAARTDVKLSRNIPVAWVYLTAWGMRDGTVQFRSDIYHHDDV